MQKIVLGIIAIIIIIAAALFFLWDGDGTPEEPTDGETVVNDTQEPTPLSSVALAENTAGSTATVSRATLTQPGYIVIYHATAGGEVAVIGSSDFLAAGDYTNLEITLESDVAAEDTLVASVHADDGDEVFEFPEDDFPVTNNNEFVTDVDVVGVPADEEEDELSVNIDAYLEENVGIDDMNDADIVDITVQAENFAFSPETITVQEGQVVRLTLESQNGTHDFVIDEIDGARTEAIQTGESTTVEFTATTAGTYDFYCSVGDHRARGMEGTFIVE